MIFGVFFCLGCYRVAFLLRKALCSSDGWVCVGGVKGFVVPLTHKVRVDDRSGSFGSKRVVSIP